MERRKILEQNIKEVKNRIMLSEQKLIRVRILHTQFTVTYVACCSRHIHCCSRHIHCVHVTYVLQQEEDLSDLIMKVIKQGLEGLVLKDTKVGVSVITAHAHTEPECGIKLCRQSVTNTVQ